MICDPKFQPSWKSFWCPAFRPSIHDPISPIHIPYLLPGSGLKSDKSAPISVFARALQTWDGWRPWNTHTHMPIRGRDLTGKMELWLSRCKRWAWRAETLQSSVSLRFWFRLLTEERVGSSMPRRDRGVQSPRARLSRTWRPRHGGLLLATFLKVPWWGDQEHESNRGGASRPVGMTELLLRFLLIKGFDAVCGLVFSFHLSLLLVIPDPGPSICIWSRVSLDFDSDPSQPRSAPFLLFHFILFYFILFFFFFFTLAHLRKYTSYLLRLCTCWYKTNPDWLATYI